MDALQAKKWREINKTKTMLASKTKVKICRKIKNVKRKVLLLAVRIGIHSSVRLCWHWRWYGFEFKDEEDVSFL